MILYTALNSPSLIFALYKSETDSPSLEFARSHIFLHNPFILFNKPSFKFTFMFEGEKGENKTGAKFSLYTVLIYLMIMTTRALNSERTELSLKSNRQSSFVDSCK